MSCSLYSRGAFDRDTFIIDNIFHYKSSSLILHCLFPYRVVDEQLVILRQQILTPQSLTTNKLHYDNRTHLTVTKILSSFATLCPLTYTTIKPCFYSTPDTLQKQWQPLCYCPVLPPPPSLVLRLCVRFGCFDHLLQEIGRGVTSLRCVLRYGQGCW